MNLHFYTTTYENSMRSTTEQLLEFIPDKGQENELINLYPQVHYQRLEGFGGAVTDSAGYVFSLMDEGQKKELVQQYFGAENMKYGLVRIPIDSCDFSLEHYEADSNETDAAFEEFSFARVEQYILPLLDAAEAAYGGRLEIMLSPWSPPVYMKTNGERNRGGKLKPEHRKRWAEYICRYIEEYRSRGYRVSKLTIQNEPKAVQTWDSCVYTAEEEKAFIRDYLWPSLVDHGLADIELYIWDHNKERAFEWAQIIIDEETDHMIAGVAFHWYSGDHFEALNMIRERFPSKKLLLSEACIEYSKFSSDDCLNNAQKYAHDLIGNLNAGMNTFLDWNLVLDEVGGPNHVKNYCDAPFLYDTKRHILCPGSIQSYLWHFSHFLEPGAVRIGMTRYTDDLEATAFQAEDKTALVVLNRTGKALPAYIRIENEVAMVRLPTQSISTGIISNL